MNRLKYIFISFFLLSSSAFSGISEEKIKESRKIAQFILNKIDNKFDHSSENEKRIIVSKKISNSYLRNLQLEYFDIDNLYQLDNRDPEVDTTNVLALAICLGNTNLLNKFLNYVDDINDSKYWVWGYGQSYTMAHLILDPQYPIRTDDISLEARLSIMDMLIQRGVNFEIVPISILCHRNPALAAGEPGGNSIKTLVKNDSGKLEYINIIDELRVRALLAGANPCVHGSSFFGLPIVSCPFLNGNYQFDQPRNIVAKYDCLSWNYYVKTISKQVTELKISSSFKPTLHPTLVDAVIKNYMEANN
ncbi:MAG: hypothetical protein Q8L85_04290 [Alphaproteobacteria bacterium]|nr:hypothetical protein [Alphaproteobacteria bacterium]